MKKVLIFLAEGFEEIEAISIIDVLRRAEISVTTVSINNNYAVKGAHNIEVKTDKLFDEVDFSNYDMIALPGGMPGAKNLNEHEGLKEQLKIFRKRQVNCCNLCSTYDIRGNGTIERKTCNMLSWI